MFLLFDVFSPFHEKVVYNLMCINANILLDLQNYECVLPLCFIFFFVFANEDLFFNGVDKTWSFSLID